MRKLVISEFVSLDGVMEEPKWTFPYWNDEFAQFKYNELFASDSLLLGRKTYEGFAQAWPGRTDEQGYGDRMNGLPKHVASTTLDKLAWNNSTVIEGDVVEGVNKLKQGDGGDILVFGSHNLAQTLIKHDLVDAFNLLIYPLALGKGVNLFDGVEGQTNLKLVESRPFASGVIMARYEPARE